MLSRPMKRFGNQDAAYRNLGSYIGQGARGIDKKLVKIYHLLELQKMLK